MIGSTAGTILYCFSAAIFDILGMNAAPESQPRGRTLASYRAEKQAKQARQARFPPLSSGLKSPQVDGALRDDYSDWLKQGRTGTTGLLSTTILEEDDSSEAGF